MNKATKYPTGRAADLPAAHTIRLSDSTRSRLEAAFADVETSPYDDIETFLAEARSALGSLSDRELLALANFVESGNSSAALLIKNLPLDRQLPLTPSSGEGRDIGRCLLSEFLMCVIGGYLGEPFGYAQERGGELFHDVLPTRQNQAKLSSQSSEVGLDFHTEMVFHPHQPAYVTLHCLRQDPGQVAATSFADLRTVLEDLNPLAVEVLSSASYHAELARLHSPYVEAVDPLTHQIVEQRPLLRVIDSEEGVERFRFEPELLTPTTEEAREAVHELEMSIAPAARCTRLEPGDLLILDNRYGVHGRTKFPATFDGRDRWLRRMHVSDRLKPGDQRVISVDPASEWAERLSMGAEDGAIA